MLLPPPPCKGGRNSPIQPLGQPQPPPPPPPPVHSGAGIHAPPSPAEQPPPPPPPPDGSPRPDAAPSSGASARTKPAARRPPTKAGGASPSRAGRRFAQAPCPGRDAPAAPIAFRWDYFPFPPPSFLGRGGARRLSIQHWTWEGRTYFQPQSKSEEQEHKGNSQLLLLLQVKAALAPAGYVLAAREKLRETSRRARASFLFNSLCLTTAARH